MRRRLRGLLAVGTVLVTCGVGAGSVAADGLPLPVDGESNVISSALGSDYFVSRPGPHSTTLVTRRNGADVLESISVRGRFGIPAVAIDGTPSGLSADDSTLALIRPRHGFPQTETRLAIVDTQPLAIRDLVTLRGDFSFDAISPDGGLLYFIHYTSPRDPTDYEVRAFDTGTRRLLADPIVDPEEADEEMRGYPMARVMSPDGRWAYTLYDGGGGTPFVHALDTVEQTAVCVDLDGLRPTSLDLDLGDDGGTLVVSDRRGPVRTIDTATFEVTDVAGAAYSPPGASGDGADGTDWLLIAAIAASLSAVVALALRHRRGLAST